MVLKCYAKTIIDLKLYTQKNYLIMIFLDKLKLSIFH